MIERELKVYYINDFSAIKSNFQNSGIIFTSAIDLQGEFLKNVIKAPKNYCIDISNWIESLNVHRDSIHGMEGLLNTIPQEVMFVCEEKLYLIAMEIFRHVFCAYSFLNIVSVNESSAPILNGDSNKKKITDLTNDELDAFLNFINNNLIGHSRFKRELDIRLRTFKLFHKLEEQKLFSIFLMGESGIGKTEVGRLMHKAFGSKTVFCKISFGNYSSKDSLNSLIGSPRGYMGSDTGELPMKIELSDVGLIVIDEFEKADNPVFNFFLDLLEEGKFTDSQSNVYDLDGYIIIFTSNLTPENYKKRLSPELRSRFDYVCQFQLLNEEEKKQYTYKRIENTLQKFESKLGVSISQEDKQRLYNIDYSLNNLRKINRSIKDRFAEIAKKYIE